jgi:ABC-type lipoprotein export system ATPase subunit
MLSELVREHGCTTVIVSHDPESTRIADRIIRIRDGRVSEEWARDDTASDTIVVGRGGWLRLPEELLLRAGIGTHATARFAEGGVIVEPKAGTQREAVSDTAPLSAAATDSAVVVEAHAVAKRYGETMVLDGLDAQFRAGRLHVVTGASGSGKTTLLHMLAGLELPDAGDIVIAGTSLAGLDRTERATLRRENVAYVGQQTGLIPHLSALENVELALELRGLGTGPAHSALDVVGLSERATQRIARLSQGERARVAIARAIAARPAVLLADEPTSRLDSANAIGVAVLLARLARDTGAAVVCSTHDPLVIEQADDETTLTGQTPR